MVYLTTIFVTVKVFFFYLDSFMNLIKIIKVIPLVVNKTDKMYL